MIKVRERQENMIDRRSERTMMGTILGVAQQDNRIRGVILSGSRANPNAKQDIFQDYDIIYVVNNVEVFVEDSEWVDQFGERLLMQTPDEMDGLWPQCKDKFTYLILFTDGNRIDLTLFDKSSLSGLPKDSQSILFLDKDNRLGGFEPPSDRDYLPHPPTEREFKNCCNEFLWVSTYVAKGIWRKELTYAKYMSEHVVKDELIKLLTWYAWMKTNFQRTMGKCGKYLQDYRDQDVWTQFVKTYVDADYLHMWGALLEMCQLFNRVALKVSSYYGYHYDEQEYQRVIEYLKEVRDIKNQ